MIHDLQDDSKIFHTASHNFKREKLTLHWYYPEQNETVKH
jgi:hypothetical protein